MPHLSRLCAALIATLVTVGTAQAQQLQRGAANPTPSAATRAAQALPNPAGLRPVFPAGLSSGSGASQSSDRIARANAPATPATTPGTTTTSASNGRTIVTTTNPDGTITQTTTTTGTNPGITPELLNSSSALFGAAAATATMGAGGAAGPSQFVPGGSAGFSAVDIARAFINADGNRDGELSRSEARRLTLTTLTFEEMDRNFDGVISRGEYEDGLR